MFCGRQILYDAEVSTPGKLAASCRFVYEMLGQGPEPFTNALHCANFDWQSFTWTLYIDFRKQIHCFYWQLFIL